MEVRWTFAGEGARGPPRGARWAAPRARASARVRHGVEIRGDGVGGGRASRRVLVRRVEGEMPRGASSEGRRFALRSRSSRASRNAATAATRDEGDDDRATTGARSCASASATGWSARRIDAPTERPSSASVSVAAPALSTGRRTTTPRVSFGAIAGATTSRISISKAHENVAACGAGDEACAPRDASSAAPSSNAASSLRCRTRNGLGSSPAVSLHRSKAKLSLLFQRGVRGVVSIDLPPPRGAPPRDSTRVRSGSNRRHRRPSSVVSPTALLNQRRLPAFCFPRCCCLRFPAKAVSSEAAGASSARCFACSAASASASFLRSSAASSSCTFFPSSSLADSSVCTRSTRSKHSMMSPASTLPTRVGADAALLESALHLLHLVLDAAQGSHLADVLFLTLARDAEVRLHAQLAVEDQHARHLGVTSAEHRLALRLADKHFVLDTRELPPSRRTSSTSP